MTGKKCLRGVVDGILYFNGSMKEWVWLDNIAHQIPISVDGREWPSTEHYFQAMKFEGTPLADRVRETIHPLEAKRLGRTGRLRPDWERVKYEVMLRAVRAKFQQHADLRAKLLSTAPFPIVEHCLDAEWGDGGNGSGKNLFGQVLTRVRAELEEKEGKETSKGGSLVALLSA
eukprot:TRINITY_DN49359_c0_g1_i1.p1 TRINITY_DN49359_c0_g1~~TRINITY_DN49359_c0_g1_i1.p1  ORF type:complete len:195 (+),score=19.45 TRINITY_DN49359_c0_g1_i1:68-586(+)